MDTSIKTGVYNWSGTIFEINYYYPKNVINGPTTDQFTVTEIDDSTIAVGAGSSIAMSFAKLHFINRNDTTKTKDYFSSINAYKLYLTYHYDTKKMTYKELKQDTMEGVERRVILETN